MQYLINRQHHYFSSSLFAGKKRAQCSSPALQTRNNPAPSTHCHRYLTSRPTRRRHYTSSPSCDNSTHPLLWGSQTIRTKTIVADTPCGLRSYITDSRTKPIQVQWFIDPKVGRRFYITIACSNYILTFFQVESKFAGVQSAFDKLDRQPHLF